MLTDCSYYDGFHNIFYTIKSIHFSTSPYLPDNDLAVLTKRILKSILFFNISGDGK